MAKQNGYWGPGQPAYDKLAKEFKRIHRLSKTPAGRRRERAYARRLLSDLLQKCERAYTKDYIEEALDDAVLLLDDALPRALRSDRKAKGASIGLRESERVDTKDHIGKALDLAIADRIVTFGCLRRYPPWVRRGLAERGREVILGIPKKRGRRTDWLHDDLLFRTVQGYIDAKMKLDTGFREHRSKELNTALGQAQAQVEGWYGEHVLRATLLNTYKRHRNKMKKVAGCWVPRAGIYVPRLSVGLPS